MANSKATKKALFMSMLSLLLCFTMLMGATFAWFTDTVTSKGNRIVAGKLKVDLVMDKPDVNGDYDGNYEIISDGTSGDIFSDANGGQGFNWEPGKTEIVYLGVQNNGSLALKYNIILNVIDEGLIGSLEYAIIDGATAEAVKNAGGNSWEAVKAKATTPVDLIKAGQTIAAQNGVLDEIAFDPTKLGETNYFALAVHMKEDAGNEYQEKGVKIDVTVVATQVEAEIDSFDDTYDAEAKFETASVEDLKKAIAEGGTIKLVNDMIIADGETLEIPANTAVVIDLNGKTITGSNAKGSGATITNKGTLTIKGGELSSTATNGDAVISNSGTLTLEDVTVNGAPMDSTGYPAYAITTSGKLTVEDGTTISADRGGISTSAGADVVINGGEIIVSDAADGRNMTLHTIYAYGSGTTLEINDGYFEMGHTSTGGASVICPAGATITINGGDFRDAMDDTNWKSTGNFQNYMGYGAPVNVRGGTYDDNTVVKNLADGYAATEDNGIWTVSAKIPANDAELSEVINAGVSEITLAKNTNYTMPSYSSTANITIKGDETSVVDVTKGAYLDEATVSFEGVTIKTSTGYVMDANGNKGSDYAALYTPNVTYTDCTFVGPMRVGRDGAKFINCTFTELGNDYVWTYGNDVTFEKCTFNSAGKAILIYSDGGNEVSEVKVTGCKFNATTGAKAGAISNQNCAAIEIHNYGNGVNLTTSGNTYDSNNFSGEWRIKTYEAGKPKVIVNGTEYTKTALDGKLMTVSGTIATID